MVLSVGGYRRQAPVIPIPWALLNDLARLGCSACRRIWHNCLLTIDASRQCHIRAQGCASAFIAPLRRDRFSLDHEHLCASKRPKPRVSALAEASRCDNRLASRHPCVPVQTLPIYGRILQYGNRTYSNDPDSRRSGYQLDSLRPRLTAARPEARI